MNCQSGMSPAQSIVPTAAISSSERRLACSMIESAIRSSSARTSWSSKPRQ
jgi:hypothetical protein